MAQAMRREFMDYFEYAEKCLEPSKGNCLCITFGLSGSGKSHFCLQARERLGLIHLRSDLERKRLFGLAPDARSDSAVEGGIYTPEATERTYRRLLELTEQLLDGGFGVVVDATFPEAAMRTPFRQLADAKGAAYRILAFEAPVAVLRERVAERSRQSTDASEADLEVLESQLRRRRPLSPEEQLTAVVIDTTGSTDWEALKKSLIRGGAGIS
jgi:predicted kinase